MQWAKADCSLPRSMPTSSRNAVSVLSRPAPDKTAVATGCADVRSMDPMPHIPRVLDFQSRAVSNGCAGGDARRHGPLDRELVFQDIVALDRLGHHLD